MRTKLSWLLLGGMGIALCACGDSGSPTGLPPDGFGYGSDEGPYGSFNDPPTSDTEMASNFNEGWACGAEQRYALSDLLLEVSVPLCEFRESCYGRDELAPPPDQGGTTPNDAIVETRDLDPSPGEIPSFCLELAMSRTGEGQGFLSCGLTKALAEVAKELPACEQHITLPQGYCMARFDRCVGDLIKAGCTSYLSGDYPLACDGIINSDDEPQPVPGQPND